MANISNELILSRIVWVVPLENEKKSDNILVRALEKYLNIFKANLYSSMCQYYFVKSPKTRIFHKELCISCAFAICWVYSIFSFVIQNKIKLEYCCSDVKHQSIHQFSALSWSNLLISMLCFMPSKNFKRYS